MTRARSAFVLLVVVAAAAASQPGAPLVAQSAAAVDAAHLDLLRWRSIGPSRGGRVLAVSGDPVDKFTFYQGTTGGGVWKTDDGGINWANVSDGYFATGSVGALEVAPSNPSVIYVGMGEACFRGNASHGDGVYKSADAGKTWTRVGLEATRQIGRLQIHPTNPDIVYVAALGDAWGPSPDRGVFRTRDGGRSWQKVLYRNENAGAIDIVLDPGHPDVLYASTLELRRYPWGFRSAGPGTALYKSTDGGDTWTDLSGKAGLPAGDKGRIGIALASSQPNRVWAIIDAAGAAQGIYRTDDGGETWTHLTDNADLTQRPWYYHHIYADPKNAEVLWALNVDLWKSTDGGTTFTEVTAPHGDFHGLWIDPQDPMRMVNANDGGATVTFNGGRSWSTILNQPTAQLYHVAVDNQTPYRVYAAQQDNTTISVPSRSDHGRITIEEWETVGGGEDGYVAPHPTDPNIVYAADHHWLHRYDRRTRQGRDISPNPETHYGWGAADIYFRVWWTF
ncbi:MAG: WD40/YVTN/BNR-like repeat-containing protein, partial [Vicinamibacterales bacterium]